MSIHNIAYKMSRGDFKIIDPGDKGVIAVDRFNANVNLETALSVETRTLLDPEQEGIWALLRYDKQNNPTDTVTVSGNFGNASQLIFDKEDQYVIMQSIEDKEILRWEVFIFDGGVSESPELNNLNMVWQGEWQSGLYEAGDVVRDNEFTMVATVDTEERAGPVAVAPPEWSVQNDSGYVNFSNPSVIYSGHEYLFTEPGWLSAVRVRVPELSASINYRIILLDVTDPDNPLYRSFEEPVLNVDDWTIVVASNVIVSAGTRLIVYLDALNSGSNTIVMGGWRNDGTSNNSGPDAQGWNRRTNNSAVRIDKTDLDSVNRTSELLGVVPDSTIQIVETASPDEFRTYRVTGEPVDMGTYVEYPVTQTDVSNSGPSNNATCTITIDIPVPQSTQYAVSNTYWPSNQPSWANVTGFLQFNGIDQPGNDDNAFGVDIRFTEAQVPNDWELVAISAASTGSDSDLSAGGQSAGGIGETFEFLFDSSTVSADPGPGLFRLNNASVPSATEIYLDNVSENGITMATLIDTLDEGNHVLLIGEDSEERALFQVSSVTNSSTWHTLTGSVVSDAGSGFNVGEKVSALYIGADTVSATFINSSTVDVAPNDEILINDISAGNLARVNASDFLLTVDPTSQTVESDVEFFGDVTIPPATLFFGADASALSSSNRTLKLTDAYGNENLIPLTQNDPVLGSDTIFYQTDAETTNVLAPDFSSQLAGPTHTFQLTATGDYLLRSVKLKARDSHTLNIKLYAGTSTSDPKVADVDYFVDIGDGPFNPPEDVEVPIPNGIVQETGDELHVVITSTQLDGDNQGSGPFSGQIKPYLAICEQVITVNSITDMAVKLDGIEDNATQDQTDAEIEAAYNAQVAIVTQAEAEAGVSTDVKRWTPERVSQAVQGLSIQLAYSFSEESNSNTGATNWQNKLQETFTPAAGDYLFTWYMELASTDSGKAVCSRVRLNNSAIGEHSIDLSNLENERVGLSGFKIETLPNSLQEIEVDWRLSPDTSGSTARIRKVRVLIFKLP